MREAMVAAALASEGLGPTAVLIMKANLSIKVKPFGGWFKVNGGRRGNGRRNR